MPTDVAIERTRTEREALAGLITALARDLQQIMDNGNLSSQGKQTRAAGTFESYETDINGRLDRLQTQARRGIEGARRSLDSHLDVTDEKIQVRSAVYGSLLSRAHDHPDQLLRVLQEQYGDPVARRLLVDTLEVVIASSTGEQQRLLQAQLEAAHLQGRQHVTAEEERLRRQLEQAEEYLRYVSAMAQVMEAALARFVRISGTERQVSTDPQQARIMALEFINGAAPAFQRYESTGRITRTNQ